MSQRIIHYDPYLSPYEKQLSERTENFKKTKKKLSPKNSLSDFAQGYKYFGFHYDNGRWIYREWAPGADRMYFTGDFCGWDIKAYPMMRLENGVFEVVVEKNICEGMRVQAIIEKNGEFLRRVPAYATHVIRDENTGLWTAELQDVCSAYQWTDNGFSPPETPLIYECHIGMAQEKYGVGTFVEFEQNVLPKVKELGYNTLQIMAVAEHPYYASFGYQVSSFFAPSSRFGTRDELKHLINAAHEMGISVLLDLVHSHAVGNVGEGLNLFDGTEYQYFHKGERGNHPSWGTKLFDYSKPEVVHFLLSNIRYWLEEFRFDGFRFDGVTSMLYKNHGMNCSFTDYSMYFSDNTDKDAVTYLCLANTLIKEINPYAVTIAEDMSGMPGMCLPVSYGGIGFSYRLSMGVPDLWIKYLKTLSDQQWNMHQLWWELNLKRAGEKQIGYCESHDQALVGDKTIMFRLCDKEMYTEMSKNSDSLVISRGISLHKMIRLLTASLSGDGYLNFMGNEFGHPEWIDFPREGNGWSYHYCRRQWSLANDGNLKYEYLNNFDKDMVHFLAQCDVMENDAVKRHISDENKVIAFEKGQYLFVFNFHPEKSHENFFVQTKRGAYKAVLSTDRKSFGGYENVDMQYVYKTERKDGETGIRLYIPSRTATVYEKVR